MVGSLSLKKELSPTKTAERPEEIVNLEQQEEEAEETPFLSRLDEYLQDGQYYSPGSLLMKDLQKEATEYVTDIAHLGPGCVFGE